MAASPLMASLIICPAVYTRKKYMHIGKSFTLLPVSDGLWKTLNSCWSEQSLKMFRTCTCLCQRRETKQNRMYFLKKEDMNISREQTQLCLTVWNDIHNRSEPNQTSSQRNTLSCFHYRGLPNVSIFVLCILRSVEHGASDSFVCSMLCQQTKNCFVRINFQTTLLHDPEACVICQSEHSRWNGLSH